MNPFYLIFDESLKFYPPTSIGPLMRKCLKTPLIISTIQNNYINRFSNCIFQIKYEYSTNYGNGTLCQGLIKKNSFCDPAPFFTGSWLSASASSKKACFYEYFYRLPLKRISSRLAVFRGFYRLQLSLKGPATASSSLVHF